MWATGIDYYRRLVPIYRGENGCFLFVGATSYGRWRVCVHIAEERVPLIFRSYARWSRRRLRNPGNEEVRDPWHDYSWEFHRGKKEDAVESFRDRFLSFRSFRHFPLVLGGKNNGTTSRPSFAPREESLFSGAKLKIKRILKIFQRSRNGRVSLTTPWVDVSQCLICALIAFLRFARNLVALRKICTIFHDSIVSLYKINN